MKNEKDAGKIQQIAVTSVTDHLMGQLTSENFKSVQNYSVILALSGFFALRAVKLSDIAGLAPLVNNEQVANYLMSTSGYVNQLAFIESKKVSLQDSENLALTIECLIKYHFDVAPLKAAQFTCLLNTLCESLLNLNNTFREHAILTCFENLQYLEDKFTVPLFKTMFEKISQVSARPAAPLGEDDSVHG